MKIIKLDSKKSRINYSLLLLFLLVKTVQINDFAKLIKLDDYFLKSLF